MLAEERFDGADGGADALDERIAVAGVGDRRRRARRRGASCRSRAAAACRRRRCPGCRRREGRCRARGRGRARGNARSSRRAGAGPWPQITSVLPRRTSWTMSGTSPPGPLRCGSTTCSVKAVATAASKALPPRSSIAHADRGRDPMRRGDDAEGAVDLGTGGEAARIDEAHDDRERRSGRMYASTLTARGGRSTAICEWRVDS